MNKILISILLIMLFFVSCKPLNNSEPLPASVFYNFDSSLNGWGSNGISNETLSINSNSNYIKAGTGSVKCNCYLSSSSIPPKIGLLYQDFGTNVNLTNRVVTLWVYVPTELAGLNPRYYIDLNIKRQSMSLIVDTFYGPALNKAGWNKITFTIPAYSTDSYNVTHDYQDVQMIYFAIENTAQTAADWTGNIYFDELSW
ncbi:MAG: hypothetical protein WCJ94_00895 [bacterium]